jgi:hypothetical protein
MEYAGYSDTSIINYLQDIDFPRSRQELIDYCEDLDAPHQVVDLLEHMPDRQYLSWSDLMDGVAEAQCPRQ